MAQVLCFAGFYLFSVYLLQQVTGISLAFWENLVVNGFTLMRRGQKKKPRLGVQNCLCVSHAEGRAFPCSGVSREGREEWMLQPPPLPCAGFQRKFLAKLGAKEVYVSFLFILSFFFAAICATLTPMNLACPRVL